MPEASFFCYNMISMQKIKVIKGGVCSARGFRAAGVGAEIKYKGRNDVALIVADAPCVAAAVFTTNKVAAAPVLLDREVVRGGKVQAILANSGCANACTGEEGLKDAKLSALVTAGELGIDPKHVLVASTGVIGRRLPMDRLLAGMKAAKAALGATYEHGLAAEKAVMTTDTKPKQACAQVTIGGKTVTVGGMSKGSGMIEPNMATMLGFVTTDAAITRFCWRSTRASTASLSMATNRPTTRSSCLPPARPATRRLRRRATTSMPFSRRLSPSASRSRSRWRRTARARPSSSR